MLKPERKSPSIPTVEMLSPFVIYAVHDEIIFDLLEFNPSPYPVLVPSSKSPPALITNSCPFLAGDACRRGTAFGHEPVMP